VYLELFSDTDLVKSEYVSELAVELLPCSQTFFREYQEFSLSLYRDCVCV